MKCRFSAGLGATKAQGQGRNVAKEYSGSYFPVAPVSQRLFKKFFVCFLKGWAVELFYIAVKT